MSWMRSGTELSQFLKKFSTYSQIFSNIKIFLCIFSCAAAIAVCTLFVCLILSDSMFCCMCLCSFRCFTLTAYKVILIYIVEKGVAQVRIFSSLLTKTQILCAH